MENPKKDKLKKDEGAKKTHIGKDSSKNEKKEKEGKSTTKGDAEHKKVELEEQQKE